MKFMALPPVRRPVPLIRGHTPTALTMGRFFHNRPITLYGSGTAALAGALARCAARARIEVPEVILPAYGCPNLVAACMRASIVPRLVDVAATNWSYDLGALSRSLSANTVAVVAVNLLGLGDGTPDLGELCRKSGDALIQDSAQFLPRGPIAWPGDYVVLSFGRGKPMNLLTGGALVDCLTGDDWAAPSGKYSARHTMLANPAAALAFNVLTRPRPYWVLSQLPGSRLGRVVYKELLTDTSPLSHGAWARINAAFGEYQKQPSYARRLWDSAIDEWKALGILPLEGPTPEIQMEPLRLALLAPNRAARDDILSRLTRAHLGASRFYGTTLPRVCRVPECVRCQGPFPNAEALADRLFTLPTHSLVTEETVRTAITQIRMWRMSRVAS